MIPGERPPGLKQPSPLLAALPTYEEQRGILRRQHPPPPLPHLHLLPPLGHTQALSSRCPPCRRRGRARSPTSLYNKEKDLFSVFDLTPFAQRQSCSLGGGGVRPPAAPPTQTLILQDQLLHTKLLKHLVQDSFFYIHCLTFFKTSGAFVCLLNCRQLQSVQMFCLHTNLS